MHTYYPYSFSPGSCIKITNAYLSCIDNTIKKQKCNSCINFMPTEIYKQILFYFLKYCTYYVYLWKTGISKNPEIKLFYKEKEGERNFLIISILRSFFLKIGTLIYPCWNIISKYLSSKKYKIINLEKRKRLLQIFPPHVPPSLCFPIRGTRRSTYPESSSGA